MGADVRMVYSPLDALRIARENPDREVVFFAIGFETTAPSTALTLRRARPEGVANFSCVCNHVTIEPPLRALLDSPELADRRLHRPRARRDRDRRAARSSSSRATTASRSSSPGSSRSTCCSRSRCCSRSSPTGRCEVEIQYRRVVSWEGNARAREAMDEVFDAARALRVARARQHPAQRAWASPTPTPSSTPSAASRCPGVQVADPARVPVRRGAEGRDQAVGVQGVRHRVHPRARDRRVHGVARGRVRGVLQLRSLRARARGGGVGRERRHARAADAARSCSGALKRRPSARRAHHDGPRRRAASSSQSLIEGLLLPALADEALAPLADAGTVALGDATLALTTDSFVVRPIRFPGGSIGELAVNGTVNDLAVSGARPLALTLSLVLEEGLDASELRAEMDAVARAAARARACEVVAGDTKVVEHGHADGMYVCTTGVGLVDPRARAVAGRARARATACWSRGRSGAHGMAIMLARGEFELRGADRLGHGVAVAGGRRAARGGRRGPALHARRHARRRRLGAERARARLGGRRAGARDATCRSSRRWRPPRSCSGSIRCTSPTRAGWSRSSRPGPPSAALAALRAVPGCEQAAEIGEVAAEPPGMVLVDTGFRRARG